MGVIHPIPAKALLTQVGVILVGLLQNSSHLVGVIPLRPQTSLAHISWA
ncbi:hypothetical protein [Synechococcus sp. WH 8016]|nr:hypothetical protein [Synechococcus sp. WH 8016]